MANDEDDQSAPSCPYRPSSTPRSEDTDDRHPFVAFKHFIDDQISAITRIPLASLQSIRMSMEQAHVEQASRDAEAHYRWTGRDTSADHDEMIVQRMTKESRDEAYYAALQLVREAAKRHAKTDPAKIKALYEDDESHSLERDPFAMPRLSFGGACYYMPETSDNMPSTASVSGRWSASPRFLSMDWFKKSVYSPINVEADLGTSGYRDAFEDLLDVTLKGKSEHRQNQSGYRPTSPDRIHSTQHSPGVDWVLSLFCRGVLPLPPMLRSVMAKGDYSTFENTFEATRRRWTSIAGSYAPDSAELQLSELVRAVASPSSPEAESSPLASRADLGPSVQQSRPAASDYTDFIALVREGKSPAKEADQFWRAIYHENANKAADMIVRWERQGRNVRELIDDPYIVRQFLHMDTHPALWPLCEALEKANSQLLFTQAVAMDEIPLGNPGQGGETHEDIRDAMLPYEDKRDAPLPLPKQSKANPKECSSQATAQAQPAPSNRNIGVLSTLTTTHRTRMPDGTVTTNTMLKKRFADGREETTTSHNVEHAGHAENQRKTTGSNNSNSNSSTDTKKPAESKSSWFWS